MIVFDLLCICGFQFEGWFQDSDSFREQQAGGLLTCPQCGAAEVHKILSPVAVHTTAADSGNSSPNQEQMQAFAAAAVLRHLQDYVRSNFEDVGPKLAAETLKIHFGVEKPRNIRGVASQEEEKVLAKEGIKLLKIPMPAPEGENGSSN
ncbi:MAG: DUF1178 family protein [Desulfobacteraceae bacterium]|nr:DUF1178 family protein [Desulfobacteraceae bacterium]